MARLIGPIQIEGTIGGISFYRNGSGVIIARQKGGPTTHALKNGRQFSITRMNNKEFGCTSQSAQFFSLVFGDLLKFSKDGSCFRRLQSLMLKALKRNVIIKRGERTVQQGDLLLLEGFEFNEKRKLTASFSVPYSCTADRSTGKMSIDIPAFVPATRILMPAEATHVRFIAAAAAIDLNKREDTRGDTETELVPLNYDSCGSFHLELDIAGGSDLPWFLALGLKYYHVTRGGEQIALNKKEFNPMAIVKVEQP